MEAVKTPGEVGANTLVPIAVENLDPGTPCPTALDMDIVTKAPCDCPHVASAVDAARSYRFN